MTDNSRPEPGDSGKTTPPARKRRRRGSRPASQPGATAGNGGDTEQQGRSGRRRRGRGKGGGSAKANQHSNAKAGEKGKGTQAGEKGPKKQGGKRSRGASGRGRSGRPNTSRYRKGSRGHNTPDTSIETRDETSAGGLVVSGMAEAVGPGGKVDLSRIYVALIGRLDRRGRLLWSMPKGHVEAGEHQWATAEREVWEETGIHGKAFEELGVIDYWFVSEGVRIHKTVHHNLLRYVDGVLNDEDPEVTEVTWVPMNELIEHLAYADERKLARIAVNRMPDLARKEADAGRATPR
ncbi:NUDIX hydrolase [Corynebacterium liangguodongii]|uniref:NUDIX hydrolase n=1 Tax=Corynebacterium liangguodongii TaxID=2079535 RepID=A0A2S0WGQ8_9CORY|nr:NUDIX hydrolase [Corynebacterium liangguodongii]AWB84953.1 NUDIX hydrolase [Corynebacterium liangguodongii]PWB99339.1 NUDIX domain-containing protein [Corynebacterium liangguodongii]